MSREHNKLIGIISENKFIKYNQFKNNWNLNTTINNKEVADNNVKNRQEAILLFRNKGLSK